MGLSFLTSHNSLTRVNINTCYSTNSVVSSSPLLLPRNGRNPLFPHELCPQNFLLAHQSRPELPRPVFVVATVVSSLLLPSSLFLHGMYPTNHLLKNSWASKFCVQPFRPVKDGLCRHHTSMIVKDLEPLLKLEMARHTNAFIPVYFLPTYTTRE